MKIVTATPSTIIDTEKTTVISMDKDTHVKLIQALAENLAETGVGRLVLRTDAGEYLIFKVLR